MLLNFPYRRPTTHYTLYATNYGNSDVVKRLMRRSDAFFAHDSKYDPAFDPCRDFYNSRYGGEYYRITKCYFEIIYLVGKSYEKSMFIIDYSLLWQEIEFVIPLKKLFTLFTFEVPVNIFSFSLFISLSQTVHTLS